MSDCHCSSGCGPAPAPTPSEQAAWISRFHVKTMDCMAEERLVRLALEPLSEVRGLLFDLGQRQLQVLHDQDIAPVAARLTSLNLGATLLDTRANLGVQADEANTAAQRRVLYALLLINAVMFVLELTMGLLAQSAGLIADSLDMFADAAVYGVALLAVGQAASRQLNAARLAGLVQGLLALLLLAEVARRWLYGSEPQSLLMIGVGLLALLANLGCLYLIHGQRHGGVHMRASWIFSANDVLANLGLITAGALVLWTGAAWPDLLIGSLVGLLVLFGAWRILRLRA
jgi:hypothetical protein